MKNISFILFFLGFQLSGYSQLKVNGSDYLKKSIADSINKIVEYSVNQFSIQNKGKISKERLGFMTDTIRIETFLSIATEKINYTDIGVLLLNQEALEKYDAMLNNYYKILFDKVENKIALKEAEKAWITFRDKEIDLYISTITDDYSTLGSLDKVMIASFRLNLTKKRTIDIFEYTMR